MPSAHSSAETVGSLTSVEKLLSFAVQLRSAVPVCASAFIYSLLSVIPLSGEEGRAEGHAVLIHRPTLPALTHHLYSRTDVVKVPERTVPYPRLGICSLATRTPPSNT